MTNCVLYPGLLCGEWVTPVSISQNGVLHLGQRYVAVRILCRRSYAWLLIVLAGVLLFAAGQSHSSRRTRSKTASPQTGQSAEELARRVLEDTRVHWRAVDRLQQQQLQNSIQKEVSSDSSNATGVPLLDPAAQTIVASGNDNELLQEPFYDHNLSTITEVSDSELSAMSLPPPNAPAFSNELRPTNRSTHSQVHCAAASSSSVSSGYGSASTQQAARAPFTGVPPPRSALICSSPGMKEYLLAEAAGMSTIGEEPTSNC